jgi:tRNA dimethylallyltransferase
MTTPHPREVLGHWDVVGRDAGRVRVVAVVGPTAAGKSDLAVTLARALGGAVVNTDSMQLYRGMDIGTAKLSARERGEVPHLLLDLWPPTRTVTVAEFQQLARAAIDECRQRGRTPVLVGGSALYVRAVLDRFEFPGTDPAVRARLEAELEAHGPQTLHAKLAARDPHAAARILSTNGRRIVRALEVLALTGGSYAASLPAKDYYYRHAMQIGLDVPWAELDARIASRVEHMWRVGFVDEVRRLEAQGLRRGVTARRAIGYAQVLRFLDGEWTEEQAREETIAATRRFARRQMRWFRKDPRVIWIPYDSPDLAQRALAAVSESQPSIGT